MSDPYEIEPLERLCGECGRDGCRGECTDIEGQLFLMDEQTYDILLRYREHVTMEIIIEHLLRNGWYHPSRPADPAAVMLKACDNRSDAGVTYHNLTAALVEDGWRVKP
jgi:hypothetical protein